MYYATLVPASLDWKVPLWLSHVSHHANIFAIDDLVPAKFSLHKMWVGNIARGVDNHEGQISTVRVATISLDISVNFVKDFTPSSFFHPFYFD